MFSNAYDPFGFVLTDPFFGYPTFGSSNQGAQGGRRGQRGVQQRLPQGNQSNNLGAMIPTGAEDAAVLDFSGLLNEPLNLQIQEKENQYEIIARRPQGLRKKDLHLEVHDNFLTISGERERHRRKHGGTQRDEYISFSRSIVLPDDVHLDNIQAKYDDHGSLVINIPRAGAKGPKSIPISGQQAQEIPHEKDQIGAAPMSTEKTSEMKSDISSEPRTQGQSVPIR